MNNEANEQLTMNNEKWGKAAGDSLYSFVSLDEFKSVLGFDDREDKLCRFCLVTSTLTIESYCMRKFIKKNYLERFSFFGDLLLPLKEYPVNTIYAVYIFGNCGGKYIGEILDPDFYSVVPDCGADENIPFSIELSPIVGRFRGVKAFKVNYSAGYVVNEIPPDLEAACLELAAWNMGRYRGKRIGMTGSIRKDGDRLEMAMPENVKALLEPYKRKVI